MASNPWDITQKTQTFGGPGTAPQTTQTFSAPNPWDGGAGSKSGLLDPGSIPQVTAAQQTAAQQTAAQQGTSPELQAMLQGKGFSPGVLAGMNATATEAPAAAGMQEMANMKRQLGQNGIKGPAAAAYSGEVANRTGQAQTAALQAVQTQNGQLSEQQKQLGLQQQTSIGMNNTNAANQVGTNNANATNQVGTNNMNAANQAALDNANRLFAALQGNQAIRYGTQNNLANQQ